MPHNTAVPTLVLAGQFDPNITPEQGRKVVDWLGSKARRVLFTGIGHNVRHFSHCAQTLVAAFIRDPDRPFDAACAAAGKAFGPARP